MRAPFSGPFAVGAGDRPLVVVLQSRQPVTVDLAEAFPARDHEVLVLTDRAGGEVFREDAGGTRPTTVTADRAVWEAEIARRCRDRAVEVVTNDEYCQQICAHIRANLGLLSHCRTPLESYLDKVVMKERLAAREVSIPRFLAFEPEVVAGETTVETVLTEVGLPLVVKPRREANSRGVEILRTAAEFERWLSQHRGETGWQVERFVEGTLHHANALVVGGILQHVQVGEYLGPLVDLGTQRCFGSVVLREDDPVSVLGRGLNEAVVDALGAEGAFVVHTEFAVTPDGEPVVLEAAARAPGALVSETARMCCGINLELAHLRLQAGLAVPEPRANGRVAGWMWLAVGPDERYRHTPDLHSEHWVHVRAVGRSGNRGDEAVVGASLLLWNDDAAVLADDVRLAEKATWFATPSPECPRTTGSGRTSG